MFVIDIFKTSRLGELGVKKQTFEAEVIAVSFFVLDDQAEELRVGEIGGDGWRSCRRSFWPCRRVSER